MTDWAGGNPERHDDDLAQALRVEVRAPDLTDSILDRVALHRTFLDRRARRLLWATRCAIGAGVLMVAGAIVFIHENYPHVRGEAPRPTPLSLVVESAQVEARRLTELPGRIEIPDAPLPSLGHTSLPIGAGAAPRQPAEIAPVTGAGPARVVAVIVSGEPEGVPTGTARADGEVAAGYPQMLLQAGASPRERLRLRNKVAFPSAAEAVHRWAITADGPALPSASGLLRSDGLQDAPLLLQGPISDEIRLPR